MAHRHRDRDNHRRSLVVRETLAIVLSQCFRCWMWHRQRAEPCRGICNWPCIVGLVFLLAEYMDRHAGKIAFLAAGLASCLAGRIPFPKGSLRRGQVSRNVPEPTPFPRPSTRAFLKVKNLRPVGLPLFPEKCFPVWPAYGMTHRVGKTPSSSGQSGHWARFHRKRQASHEVPIVSSVFTARSAMPAVEHHTCVCGSVVNTTLYTRPSSSQHRRGRDQGGVGELSPRFHGDVAAVHLHLLVGHFCIAGRGLHLGVGGLSGDVSPGVADDHVSSSMRCLSTPLSATAPPQHALASSKAEAVGVGMGKETSSSPGSVCVKSVACRRLRRLCPVWPTWSEVCKNRRRPAQFLESSETRSVFMKPWARPHTWYRFSTDKAPSGAAQRDGALGSVRNKLWPN